MLCNVQDKLWAKHQMLRKAGVPEEVPVDDACEECHLLHAQGFSFLTWEELVQMSETSPTIGKAIQQARVVNQGAVKDFFDAKLDSVVQVGYKIKKCARLLTRSEFKDLTGHDLTRAAVKAVVQTVEAVNEDGQATELFALVKDETRPYTTIEAFQLSLNELSTARMPKHLFPDQGSMTMRACASAARKKAGMQVLASGTLLSMDEMLAKMKEKMPAKAKAKDSDDDDSEVEAAASTSVGPKGPILSEVLQGSGSKKRKKKGKAGAIDQKGKAPEKGLESGFGIVTPTKPEGQRKSNVCEESDLDEEEDQDAVGDLADAMSVSMMDDGGPTGTLIGNNAKAHGWILKLPLRGVLNDEKIGREKRFALKWLLKVTKEGLIGVGDASQLKSHLALVDICEKLTAKALPALTEEELRQSLHPICEAKVDIPPSVIDALLYRRLAVLIKHCEKPSKESFAALASVLKPPCEEKPCSMDVFEPTLAGLARHKDVKEMVVLFNKVIFKEILLPRVAAGADEAQFVKLMSCTFLQELEDSIATATGLWATTLFDATVVWRALAALTATGITGATAVSEVTDLQQGGAKRGQGTVMHEFSKKIEATEYYNKAMQHYLQKSVHLTRFRDTLARWEKIPDCDRLGERLDTATAMCKDLATLQTVFAPSDIKGFLTRGMAYVKAIFGELKNEQGYESGGEILSKSLKMMEEALLAYPADDALIKFNVLLTNASKGLAAKQQIANVTGIIHRLPSVLEASAPQIDAWRTDLRKSVVFVSSLPDEEAMASLPVLAALAIRATSDATTHSQALVCVDGTTLLSKFCDKTLALKENATVALEVKTLQTLVADVVAARHSLTAFTVLGPSLSARCGKDSDQMAVASLWRATERLSTAMDVATKVLKNNANAVHGGLSAVHAGAIGLLKSARESRDEAIAYLADMCNKRGRQSVDKLKALACGTDDNIPWHRNMWDESYTALAEHAAKGLLKADGALLVEANKRCKEALRILF